MSSPLSFGGPSKRSGSDHGSDTRKSLGFAFHGGKPRPIRPPKGKNGPVKIIKKATKLVEKVKDD